MTNHFRQAEFQGKPIQAGRLQGFEAVQLGAREVKTHVLDIEGDDASAVCVIPGIWTPEKGAEVKLHDPERTATVERVDYLFDESGLSVSVWLRDPLTAPPYRAAGFP